ncbi:MAG: UvrD-helicase domain-containing protein [Anaeromicrobium sp.]|jgi:hypothetical protein|uniref:UvrD-helicase domain-containing protein n=1 Tax=Anaeromicrobium sp. TaxID=1929132 RepID=UPI0025FBB6F8|nr:UvrD-helicase domain-containing protein [Anaeromicrobium sp.]MCT4595795.1 UvrD-helicase domain-containing protein [Anaeromicrobium sp.]
MNKYETYSDGVIKIDRIFQNFPGKFLIDGERNSGKTSGAIRLYKKLIEENISSDKILVIYFGAMAGLNWREKLVFPSINKINGQTYYSFIKNELNIYWPIVLKNCHRINKRIIKPKFMSYDLSYYMMKLLVNHYRNKKNMLLDITSSSEKVARTLISNINICAENLVDFEKIGEKLFYSLDLANTLEKNTYDEINTVINQYISSLIQKGTIDYALSVYLYNEFLIKDEAYLKNLESRFDYVMVDDFEKSNKAILNLVNKIEPKGLYLFGNMKFNREYTKDLLDYINNSFETINLPCEREKNLVGDFVESFVDYHMKGKLSIKSNPSVKIDNNHILRGQMIEGICHRIERLFDEGYKGNDVVIITPIKDEILEYNIRKKFENTNIVTFVNSDRISKDEHMHSLIFLCGLCKDFKRINFNRDDYKKFFINYFHLNMLDASRLGDEAYERGFFNVDFPMDEYRGLKSYMEEMIKENNRIDKLMEKVYIDKILKMKDGEKKAGIVKNIIDTSSNFMDIMEDFNKIKYPEEKLLNILIDEKIKLNKINDFRQLKDNKDTLFIMTPDTYINSNLNNKIQIWVDISSSTWSMRTKKELSNPHVFKVDKDKYTTYTEELENILQRQIILYNVSTLLRACTDKVYFFSSEYSKRGYEQNNVMYDMLLDPLEKFGDNYEL